MGITAQRRWRERAAGAQSAAASPPAFVSQAEHQLALQELTKTLGLRVSELEAELAAREGALSFKIDVDSEEFEAAIKPMVEEFEARVKEALERAEKADLAAGELQTKLDETLAKVAELEGVNQQLAELLEQAKTAPPDATEVPPQGELAAADAEPKGEPVAEVAAPAEKPSEEGDATKPAGKGPKPKPR